MILRLIPLNGPEHKMLNVENLFSLENKNIFITGSTGFLGKNLVEFLAQQGANLIIHGKDLKKIESFYSNLIKKNYSIKPIVFDLTDEKALKKEVNKVIKTNIDVLINNAYQGTSGSFFYTYSKDYRNSYEISLVATHNLIKVLYPLLLKSKKVNGDASIINISSMYGFLSPDLKIYIDLKKANPPHYGAAKAALIQYTKYIACEFANDGIRVNSISPGAIPSPQFRKKYPSTVSKLEKKIPMKRLGKPIDITGPIMYLATKSSKYVTGTNLIVDGGYSAW